jgi:hypothetical protein
MQISCHSRDRGEESSGAEEDLLLSLEMNGAAIGHFSGHRWTLAPDFPVLRNGSGRSVIATWRHPECNFFNTW